MDRTILEVKGADRATFLQGLVTNDVRRLPDGPIYAAILTPQGKYLADFFLIEHEDAILIDVKSDLASALAQRLNMYKLRADVVISESALTVSRGLGDVPKGAMNDPRHPALGWRMYSKTHRAGATDWGAIRVANMIPETGIELTPDSYILESDFERLNGVDFRKGCYVGQEVTARMKHKTELKKGLVTVQIDGQAAPGTAITADGKPAGTLFTQSGKQAIAYLRFDRAHATMQANDARITWAGKPSD